MSEKDTSKSGTDDVLPVLPGRLSSPRPTRQQMTEAARAFRKVPATSEHPLWQALKRGHLEGYKFRRQHPIGPFIVDFFCPAKKLIVEIDGPIHDNQQDRDRERQTLLETRGYQVFRVTAASVEENVQTVLTNIAEALRDTSP